MTNKVIMYAAYLAISIALTVWVGRTLSRNGKVFLEDAFADIRLATSVNHLLVVGFYLLNLGYMSVTMRVGATVADTAAVMEELSVKIGFVLLVLGVVHFFNLYALGRYRRSRLRQAGSAPAFAVPRQPTPAELAWAQQQAQAHAMAQAARSAQAATPAGREGA